MCIWNKIEKYINKDVGEAAKEMYKDIFIHTLQGKDTSFSVIDIRCNSASSTGKRKLTSGHLYMLLEGYDIKDGAVVKTLWRDEQDKLYDDYYTESLNAALETGSSSKRSW